ncbi:MAG TPA: hypothetical protein VIR78_04705 [Malonomonas sp.]
MFRRTYLGLEICRDGMRAIAVQRKGMGTALLGGQTLKLSDGVLCPVVQEPNVLKPDAFVEAVREVLMPLAHGEERIAVALPDAAGHVFLLELDTPFKNRSEGAEIVRWKLKDLLPDKLTRISVDYQVLEERESGSKRVLASVIAQDVLTQYEELLIKAGFAPCLIDFHAMTLYSAYRSIVDMGADYFLIGVDNRQLSILAFENKLLDFYRIKGVVNDPEQIFQEINRSMTGYRRAHAAASRSAVYLHTDWPQRDELCDAVRSAFDRDIQLLPSPLSRLNTTGKLTISAAEANGMAVALGMAERMIQRVS